MTGSRWDSPGSGDGLEATRLSREKTFEIPLVDNAILGRLAAESVGGPV